MIQIQIYKPYIKVREDEQAYQMKELMSHPKTSTNEWIPEIPNNHRTNNNTLKPAPDINQISEKMKKKAYQMSTTPKT